MQRFRIFVQDVGQRRYSSLDRDVPADNAAEALTIYREDERAAGHSLIAKKMIAISLDRKDLWPDRDGRIPHEAFEICPPMEGE